VNWFEKMKSGILTRIKREIPEGIWAKCDSCSQSTYHNALERNHWICPHCSHHFAIPHDKYVEILADAGTFEEINAAISTADPLKFKDHKRYADRIKDARKSSRMNEAIHTGVCRMGGQPVALGVMDTRFILGSMGGATGEKIARLIDRANDDRRSLVIVCQSGGARMQESTYSLMQMAKISARLKRFSNAGLLYIPVLTDPTYGGVTASFAMLGDVILAEPGSRIGFAGQSVIKQFLGTEELPEGFQIAESVLEHGFVDRVVSRDGLASMISRLIALLAPSPPAGASLAAMSQGAQPQGAISAGN